MSPGSLLKRAFIDPGECETFCVSTGIQVRARARAELLDRLVQGRIGNCNCGYVMFEKR